MQICRVAGYKAATNARATSWADMRFSDGLIFKPETALPTGLRQVNVLPAEPFPKAPRVGPGYVHGHNVGAARNRRDAKSRVTGQRLEDAFRLAPGGLVFIQKIVHEFQSYSGVRPGAGQPAAEHGGARGTASP